MGVSVLKSASVRRPAARWLLLAAVLVAPAAAYSYQLNPLKDRHAGGGLPGVGRGVDSVHEDLTHAAMACAAKAGQGDPLGPEPLCREPVRSRRAGEPGNIGIPLIVGTWWNDDPRQFVLNRHIITAALQWWEALRTARMVRRTGGRHRDGITSRLMYRSHFGDLQFLHAMANRNGESAAETRQRIMAWLEFTYGVATGTIRRETRLGALSHPLQHAFAAERSWTVERLFKPRAGMEQLPLGELALGSMLHVAQDSYAASHVRRDMTPSAACPAGRVTSFHSFLHQDVGRHRAEDTRAALDRSTATRFTSVQNPVEASARLIVLARRGADWATVVEPFLRATLFCLDFDAQPSGPSEFA